ncbi:MAG: hypothetical protein Tsb0021_02830 [Chlamydiales bacterium]
MSEETPEEMAEGPPSSLENKVPRWLIWVYVLLPIWGIITLAIYWNGNRGGWLDRGYWEQLQRSANTTYPFINHNNPELDKEIENER